MWYKDIIYQKPSYVNTESMNVPDLNIDTELSGLYQELNVCMEQYDSILGPNKALKNIERYYKKNKDDPVAFTIAKEAAAFYNASIDSNVFITHSESVLGTVKDIIVKIWEKIKEILSRIVNFIFKRTNKLKEKEKKVNEEMKEIQKLNKEKNINMLKNNEILKKSIERFGEETQKTMGSINSLRETINNKGKK